MKNIMSIIKNLIVNTDFQRERIIKLLSTILTEPDEIEFIANDILGLDEETIIEYIELYKNLTDEMDQFISDEEYSLEA